MNKQKLIAKTFAGLEELLAKELEAIGAENIEQGNRMVTFDGDKEMLYKANFCLRTAVKVLKPIREFKATDADEVYEEVKKIEWSDYMDVDDTFIVDAVVFSDEFRHSRFAAYRVKDAIADYFREKTGKRPNVGISNPDIRINIHISENDVTISLDSSGESLHHRGYRVGTVAAPLNEVLAAAIVMLTGWDGQSDLIDPMCGSGTILIEAALIARNIYPGVFRKEFAFERWKDFDPDLLDAIYNDDSHEREFTHKIYGYDINRRAVSVAQENAKSAGVADIVEVAQQDFRDFEKPTEPAIIITNPPYGERITTDDILGLYEDIGRTLKHSFAGGDAWILSLHEECFARIGFRPSTRIILYNGALECELRKYQVFEGKLRERREEGMDIKSDADRERNLRFKGRKQHQDNDTDHDELLSRDDLPDWVRKKIEHNDKGTERKRRPRFDDDDDSMDNVFSDDGPRLNRKNFKWGDRHNDFRDDKDDHYFKSKPFRNSWSDKRSWNDDSQSSRPDGRKPRGDRFASKSDNRKSRFGRGAEQSDDRRRGFDNRSSRFDGRSSKSDDRPSRSDGRQSRPGSRPRKSDN